MSIFINLPVSDLERSQAFFTALGWTINDDFTDDNAACVVIDDRTFLMILRRDYYATFLPEPKRVGDPATTSLALIAFDLPSREAVDAFVSRVTDAGGTVGETQDLGFMYQRQFDDPDGNHFEPFWMDPTAVDGQ